MLKKSISCFLMIVVLFSVFTISISASESTSYTYTLSVKKEWVRTQDAYMPGQVFLNDGTLSAPEDLFVYGDDIYIADTVETNGVKVGKIVVYHKKTGTSDSFGQDYLINPTGLYVTEDAVYVADKGAETVYKLSHDGEILMKLKRPDSYLFSQKSHYIPTGVAVTSQGIIFICGDGAYEGLMQFDKNGVFQGYFAANSTNLSFTERLQELIFNEEQMSQLLNRIPNPIYNLDISERDLIYSVTQLEGTTLWSVATQTENAVKYHNMAGKDILSSDLIAGEHNFMDIAAYKDGLSFAVTSTGIIYEYDDSGDVVFSFGGLATSDRSGHFIYAVAIDVDEDGNLYILDKEHAYFQAFFPTEFAVATHQALYSLNNGSYADSESTWLDLLSLNGMSYVAHRGYAKVLYNQMRFSEAAEQFKIIGDKKNYSECIWEIRNAWFQKNLPILFACILVLALLAFLYGFLKRKGKIKQYKISSQLLIQISNNLLFAKGILKNPFDEFYYIKRKQHGSVISATVIFLLAFLVYMLDLLCRSFTFSVSGDGTHPFSIAAIFLSCALLWVTGNFMVSAISEGEGTLRSVYIATAYSLIPYTIFGFLTFASTYVFTLNEAVVVNLLWTVGIGWSAVLLVLSVKEIHNYTGKETVKIILLTLFFMIMAVIVCVILYLIAQQVTAFVRDIIYEVAYRVES